MPANFSARCWIAGKRIFRSEDLPLVYYYSLDEYLKKVFGTKTYKIALSTGCSCPNRDGTLGTSGCLFCGEMGAGEFAQSNILPLNEQIDRAIALVAHKAKSDSFIAYFQNFTNTYGPIERLEPLFRDAISHPKIVALSVATRPDSIREEMYDLLFSLARKKPVWVELGLQTSNETTAAMLRRGFDNTCYEAAVNRLRQGGIKVIVHLILGLPGESKADILASVDYISRIGVDGVKLQLLHVLRGTDLADMYAKGLIDVLTREEYFELLAAAVERLPREVTIHRLTGDGAKSILVAPLWSADKRSVQNAMRRYFIEHDVEQGRYCALTEPGIPNNSL